LDRYSERVSTVAITLNIAMHDGGIKLQLFPKAGKNLILITARKITTVITTLA
jgi:hypothetical protein